MHSDPLGLTAWRSLWRVRGFRHFTQGAMNRVWRAESCPVCRATSQGGNDECLQEQLSDTTSREPLPMLVE